LPSQDKLQDRQQTLALFLAKAAIWHRQILPQELHQASPEIRLQGPQMQLVVAASTILEEMLQLEQEVLDSQSSKPLLLGFCLCYWLMSFLKVNTESTRTSES
jgi:hypothetical protein